MTENVYEPLGDILEALEGGCTVISCAGPPKCLFTGDDAVAAQEAGCPNCRRFDIDAEGNEIEYRAKVQ